MQLYVIGSNAKLGRWNVQEGLKLSYAGDSIWQADAVMPRSEFPIKYPFRNFSNNLMVPDILFD